MKILFKDEQKNELIKWSHELRTTQKSQGRGCLRTYDNEFCCLGVYADIIHPERWSSVSNNNWNIRSDVEGGFENMFGSSLYHDVDLPDLWAERLGLDKTLVLEDNSLTSVQAIFIELNDDVGWSFSQIADEIDCLVERGWFSDECIENLFTKVLSVKFKENDGTEGKEEFQS